eukprot:TRINITY_DN3769_c0_g1_i2.p1 TRINITY_DN3769_c0_g1~~TRINITY_DN3769_c0_g1_i2.p1  ORF type:complete len:640 (-),score=189.68 TRINITY_DN3769_c0_g1_i2:122-2041(-)
MFTVREKEKISVKVFSSHIPAVEYVAQRIVSRIKAKEEAGQTCVLGLATGSTPIKLYQRLVQLHKEGQVSFKNVVTFNLDEYYPMAPETYQSYHRFMHEHLFNHIDIPRENVNIPDGTVAIDDVQSYCEAYDAKILHYGGIDIQILGIGRTGHIGFNEPGSSMKSRTRLVTLDQRTRNDAASDFFGLEFVPLKAITMGVSTILAAREVYLMAWGEGKAKIVAKAVEGPMTDEVPSTFLQAHEKAEIVIDEPAAAELTRMKAPWLVMPCDWKNIELVKKAVVWLATRTKKAILKLTNGDYQDNGLGELLTFYHTAYSINLMVFNLIQRTITGWPGGKPNEDDQHRPVKKTPFPKRVIIFSPHPDDDVISMGGTFIRLVDQKHEVHVAYQTSGNIAVSDSDALRHLDFVRGLGRVVHFDEKDHVGKLEEDLLEYIKNKTQGTVERGEMLSIKGLIRKSEAVAACRYVGIPADRAHFLDLPFYETGKVEKKPLGQEDIDIVKKFLQKIKPDMIFAAGDLTDPHGTHRVCFFALIGALKSLRDNKEAEDWLPNADLWLYRGAWQEWDIDQIQMAVPLSPDEVLKKRNAIFKHQSQKDFPMFPGNDKREFWMRAEDRNRGTANTYNTLGFPEYEAIEAFVRYQY